MGMLSGRSCSRDGAVSMSVFMFRLVFRWYRRLSSARRRLCKLKKYIDIISLVHLCFRSTRSHLPFDKFHLYTK